MPRQCGKLLTAASAVMLFVVIVSSTSANLFRNPFIDRELSGPLTLKPEWLELTPIEPLRVERDTQQVTIFPDGPTKMVEDGFDLIPRNGHPVHVEVELVDINGITHRSDGDEANLTGSRFVISRSFFFGKPSKDMTFKTVRVRSSVPFRASKIVWRCFNFSDVHH